MSYLSCYCLEDIKDKYENVNQNYLQVYFSEYHLKKNSFRFYFKIKSHFGHRAA